MSDEFTQNENVTQSQDNPYQSGDYSQPQDNPYQGQSYSQPQDNPYQGQSYSQPQDNPYQQSYGQPQGNTYQQYGSNQYYGQMTPRKGDGTGFGIASLVLGVLSIFMFACCVNYIMAILAIVFGILQLVKSEKKGMAIAGIITAAISIILGTVFWIAIANAEENGDFQNFYKRYYNNNSYDYDSSDSFDDFFDQYMEEYAPEDDEL